MKTITIKVTKRDIGLCIDSAQDPFSCPVCRAAKRALKQDCSVGFIFIRTQGDSYVLPKKVGIWQHRLIAGKPVKPFTFNLRIP